MDFKLVLDIDAPRTLTQRLKSLSTVAAENQFWDQLQGTIQNREQLLGSVTERHQKIRQDFATNISEILKKELYNQYLPTPPAPTPPAPPSPRDHEISQAINALKIHVTSIRGGSLEILLFVLGFAKLVDVVGIKPDEFAKYLAIVAPVAMNLVFGGTVTASAAPVDAASNGQAPDGSGNRQGILVPTQGGPYVLPAIFATAVVGFAMWAFTGISGGLVDERQKLAGFVHEEMGKIEQERASMLDNFAKMAATHETAFSNERVVLVGKATELLQEVAKLLDTKQHAIESAQKILFDTQLALVKNANEVTAARENAVVEFVKTHLDVPGKPSTPANLNACIYNDVLIGRVQLALRELHLYAGRIDGVSGSGTQAGLHKFQMRAKLPVTGIPDPTTVERLGINCGDRGRF